MYTLYHGDCLEVFPSISDQSVDCVIADLPYGSTKQPWDVIIPLKPMWDALWRIIKPRGSIILFANQPFASELITSAIQWHKYDLIWDKKFSGAFATANKRPLQTFEAIHVFYKLQPTYNPQMTKRAVPIKSGKRTNPRWKTGTEDVETYAAEQKTYNLKYPTAIIHIPRKLGIKTQHPTEKPVELMEYLIHTYTNEGDTVLDFCMGVGSTGVAALNTSRNFIGIEKDETYFNIAQERITQCI